MYTVTTDVGVALLFSNPTIDRIINKLQQHRARTATVLKRDGTVVLTLRRNGENKWKPTPSCNNFHRELSAKALV